MKQRPMLVALLLLGTQPIHAADDVAAPIIVTATRTAQTADESLAAVTVITRADIERQQAVTVEDLLHGLPGVNFTNNGGIGKATSVTLRGTNSDHVLVLVDGVKVGSATLGLAMFHNMPVEQIERIEIVRGPRSSLYGSEAIGGVIQIFTRKGGGEFTPTLSLGAGSHNTGSGSIGLSGGGEHGWFNVSGSGLSSDGYNSCRGSLAAGCYTIEPDKDGYHSGSGAFRGGYRFGNNTEVDVHALRTTGYNQYDGSSTNETRIVQQAAGARVAFSPLAPWRVTVAAGNSRDESKDYLNSVFSDRYTTSRDSASLQNDIAFGTGQLLTAGYDYQNDSVDSTTVYTVSERRNTGVFAQYQGKLGRQDVQLSVRNDNNEQFGTHTTGGVAWGYGFTPATRLFASWGSAFKAPSFNQLYYPAYGNPNLQPEQSQSIEAGLRSRSGTNRWSLNLFETKVIDLIALDPTWTPANINIARIRGIEVAGGTQFAGWNIGGNLTLLDPVNRSGGANDGNVLPRRAKETARIDLDRRFGKLRAGTAIVGEGKRYDNLANTVELKAYATVDLRADYELSKNWTLGGRVGNLLDKHYETAAYFNQDGRNYFINLRYSPAR